MSERGAALLYTAGPALLADALRQFGAVRLRANGGSMSPAILPRDILVVTTCSVHDLRPRDVVLFARDGRLFAHRVRGILGPSGRQVLVTRGDAAWRNDPPVAASALLGLVVAVGRRDAFRAPAPCTRLGRARALVASEWTAVRRRRSLDLLGE